ncbi:MAG TPA: hypothetical protein IAC75_00885, partial [Candidatus Spyradosoma merdigallinarum]|nr:hypothetical protein [Candidatus Spyradosoma merdigallinarum]
LWERPETAAFVAKLSALSHAGTRLILETPAGFEPPVPAGWTLLRRIGKKGKDQPCASVFVPAA